MNRIRKILEKLVSIAERKSNKNSECIWKAILIVLIDEELMKNTLGNGIFSLFYNDFLKENLFNSEEHELIPRLIFEIEHLDSN